MTRLKFPAKKERAIFLEIAEASSNDTTERDAIIGALLSEVWTIGDDLQWAYLQLGSEEQIDRATLSRVVEGEWAWASRTGTGLPEDIKPGTEKAYRYLADLDISAYSRAFREGFIETLILSREEFDKKIKRRLLVPKRRGGRGDDLLTKLMRRTYNALLKKGERPSARDVLLALQDYDNHGDPTVVRVGSKSNEPDNAFVSWNDSKDDIQSTGWHAIEKRMSRIRNDP